MIVGTIGMNIFYKYLHHDIYKIIGDIYSKIVGEPMWKKIIFGIRVIHIHGILIIE